MKWLFTQSEITATMEWVESVGMIPIKMTSDGDHIIIEVTGGAYVNAYVDQRLNPTHRSIEIEILATLIKEVK